MAKKAKTKVKEANHPNLCPNCLRKGKKVMMTTRGQSELECSKCNCWMPNPKFKETKEQEIARLEARINSLKQ